MPEEDPFCNLVGKPGTRISSDSKTGSLPGLVQMDVADFTSIPLCWNPVLDFWRRSYTIYPRNPSIFQNASVTENIAAD